MPSRRTPPSSRPAESSADKKHGKEAPIADLRKQFARKTPQTPDDEARTRAFIEGKIDMIRGDVTMTPAEKAAAIADLKARL
jgi:hypothetical protein